MIERRTFLTGATALLLAIPTARAQQKIPRIAYVSRGVPGGFAIEAVLQGLRDHGYVEDENITIEYYWFREFNELPLLLPRVVASRPDVIVAIQTPTALATKGATEDIPIVIAAIAIADAVAVGIVPSLARPGANVPGFTSTWPALPANDCSS
jgi:putative ABC transport system substrate-binding protein